MKQSRKMKIWIELLPDVMDHFNPMAEAEIALLDEEIASAKKAKAKLEQKDSEKEEQLKPSPQPPTLDTWS